MDTPKTILSLLRSRAIDFSKRPWEATSVPVDTSVDLPDVSVKGVTTGLDTVTIPVLQYSFVMSCSLDNYNNLMLLKSFDVPAVGLNFSMSEEQMWFPAPKPNVPNCSLTGYLTDYTLAKTLVAAHLSQFRYGLMSIHKGMDICVSLIQWEEDAVAGFPSILEKIPFVSNLLSEAAAITPSINVGSLLNGVLIGKDLMENNKIVARSQAWIGEGGGNSYRHYPIMLLKNCRIGPPNMSAASDSTEIATVRVDLAYHRALWLI